MRELVVEADGGSRGNPGVAGYGALVRDAATGDLLAERAAPLGRASNNVAEYQGMIAGLEAAEQIDPSARVAVRMDSKLVVEQMAGRWKIKHEDMKRLALQGQSIVRRRREAGGQVTWTWIPRAENSAADKLSNDGMDGQRVSRDLWRDDASVSRAWPEPEAAAGTQDQIPAPVPTFQRRPDLGEATRVVLLRHGVTDFTVGRRLDGRGGADPSLNEQGRAQAAAAARELARRFDGGTQVVTSSLARARQTGGLVAQELGVTPTVDADWDEQDVGSWDGLTFAEIEQRYPGHLARMRVEEDFRPEGGESHDELAARVAAGFRRAVEQAGPGGTVIVATHRKPLMTVVGLLLELDPEHAWMLQADPGTFTTVQVWSDGNAAIEGLNDRAHLR